LTGNVSIEKQLSSAARAPKTAELIANSLRTDIVRGKLKSGDTLPGEADLVKHFDVSRPTLREAFRILESESLIVVRRGSIGGILVSAPSTTAAARDFGLLLQVSGVTLADVYEARTVIEPYAVRALASRKSPDAVEELKAATSALALLMKQGDEHPDYHVWSEAAYAFHHTLIQRSGNATLALISSVLQDVTTKHMERAVRTRTADQPGTDRESRKVIRSFNKVTALIESGQADEAEKFWKSYLANTGKRMLWGSLAKDTVVDLFA
jgi:GntR family transcriptional regulator, transcriptional repressor for pyruvate dehydrogenase complex